MRRFIYNMPLPEDLAAVIRDQVRGYLRSAVTVMAESVAAGGKKRRREPRLRAAAALKFVSRG
jgi:hypothetical protein